MAGALIVTAEVAPPDFAWLDRLRRAHFPAERNQLSAHLTMFHALPPSVEGEVRATLSRFASERPPSASIEGLMNLGGGVAFRVASQDLDRIRRELVQDFHGLLSAQDGGGWRPHVTIQNKVRPVLAKAVLAALSRDFAAREVEIAGLASWWYRGGPWEAHSRHMFA